MARPPLNLDMTLLRTFVTIVDKNGFSRAARALHLTQSAISHHVRRLEEQLDKKLFRTAGREKRLTETGEQFLWYARQILLLNDDACANIAQMGEPLIAIRLGVPEYFAQDFLPVLLSLFQSAHPTFRVRTVLGRSSVLLEMMSRDELDVTLTVEPQPVTASAHGLPITRKDLVWLSAPDRPVGPDATVPLIVFTSPCILRDIQSSALSRNGRNAVIAYEATSLGDLIASLRAGLGVCALPDTPSRYNSRVLGPADGLPSLPPLWIGMRWSPRLNHSEMEWLIERVRHCWNQTAGVPALS